MTTLIWEEIDNYHKRTKIPGGWIVKAHEDVVSPVDRESLDRKMGYEWRIAMCFVPDPNHEWEI